MAQPTSLLSRRSIMPTPDPPSSLGSGLVADSSSMQETWKRIRRASLSNELVLLRGESGTGKSFIARKIHALSKRRERPFVEVCLTSDVGSDNMVQSDLFGHEKGAFTGATEQKLGLFALADGGTIFLDEIGDATSALQAKLLRVIETGTFKRLGGTTDLQVDVRVITATNRDLETMVKAGDFREDLYYRVGVIPIQLPPLRERRADIPSLAEYLLGRCQRGRSGVPKRMAAGLAALLVDYPWPGNIRELDHSLRYAVAMAEEPAITTADLPDVVQDALERRAGPAPLTADATENGERPMIDIAQLRSAIRGMRPAADTPPHADPAHIEHAKRIWLATLIDECGGDLGLIARFWDRSAEKTLRNQVRAYGLADELAAARARGRRE